MRSGVMVHLCRKRYGFRATAWIGERHLEQRVHGRAVVHAVEDIRWMDKGSLLRGQGFTRHMNSKHIFIYSDSESLAKGRLEVEVSLPSLGDRDANLRMRAQSLLIRVEPPASPVERHGFAILNRSRKQPEGAILLKRWT
jgi:hypothetical protein